MNLREVISKLKEIEGNESLISELEKEVEILENKSKGIESKNQEIQDLKTSISNKDGEISNLEKQIEEIRTKGDSTTNGFKTLYEEQKNKVEALKNEVETLKTSKNELETMKIKQEEKLKDEINLLYKELPEDKKEFVKNMADKYPIEERISFITDFIEQFGGTSNKKKGGKILNNDVNQEMEDAKALYDELLAIPSHRRTQKQRKDLITLGKILSGKISLN